MEVRVQGTDELKPVGTIPPVYGEVAKLARHSVLIREIVGSNPIFPTNLKSELNCGSQSADPGYFSGLE